MCSCKSIHVNNDAYFDGMQHDVARREVDGMNGNITGLKRQSLMNCIVLEPFWTELAAMLSVPV